MSVTVADPQWFSANYRKAARHLVTARPACYVRLSELQPPALREATEPVAGDPCRHSRPRLSKRVAGPCRPVGGNYMHKVLLALVAAVALVSVATSGASTQTQQSGAFRADVVRMFTDLTPVAAALDQSAGTTNNSSSVAAARRSVTAMSPAQLAVLRKAFSAYPSWRSFPARLAKLVARLPQGRLSTYGVKITPNDCVASRAPGLTQEDIEIAADVSFAATAVLEAVPQDSVDEVGRGIAVALWAIPTTVERAFDHLYNVAQACDADDQAAQITAIQTAVNGITNGFTTVENAITALKTDVDTSFTTVNTATTNIQTAVNLANTAITAVQTAITALKTRRGQQLHRCQHGDHERSDGRQPGQHPARHADGQRCGRQRPEHPAAHRGGSREPGRTTRSRSSSCRPLRAATSSWRARSWRTSSPR